MRLGVYYLQKQFINAISIPALLDEKVFQPDQTAKQDAQFLVAEIQISFLAEHDNHSSFAFIVTDMLCSRQMCEYDLWNLSF